MTKSNLKSESEVTRGYCPYISASQDTEGGKGKDRQRIASPQTNEISFVLVIGEPILANELLEESTRALGERFSTLRKETPGEVFLVVSDVRSGTVAAILQL